MSQKGAIYAAKHGKTYEEILSFYYPGCNICIVEEETIKRWKLRKTFTHTQAI